MSLLLLCTGCATTDDRYIQAKVAETKAEEAQKALQLVDQAVQLLANQPPFPEQCKQVIYSHVLDTDRTDIALDKVDLALTLANRRILHCAEWGTTIESNLSALKNISTP